MRQQASLQQTELGRNLRRRRYTGGHFDHYVAKYTSWQAGGLDKHVFDKPPNCKPEGVEVTARRPGLDLRTELLALLPPAFHGANRNGVGKRSLMTSDARSQQHSSPAGLWVQHCCSPASAVVGSQECGRQHGPKWQC